MEIRGIKLSPKFKMVNLSQEQGGEDLLFRVSGAFAENQINLIWVISISQPGIQKTILGVSEEDHRKIDFLLKETLSDANPRLHSDCRMMAIFPTRSNFQVLGKSLIGFLNFKLLPMAVASSASSLTFVLDEPMIARAKDTIGEFFTLPSNFLIQEPIIPDGCKVRKGPETSAAFFESRIKTYGFECESDLIKIGISIENPHWRYWLELFVALGLENQRFRLVSCCENQTTSGLEVLLVLDKKCFDAMRNHVSSSRFRDIRCQTPVESVYFQGPHFGDRFGILSSALTALKKRNLKWIDVSCSGSSIYLVLPEGTSSSAKEALFDRFEVPTEKNHEKRNEKN